MKTSFHSRKIIQFLLMSGIYCASAQWATNRNHIYNTYSVMSVLEIIHRQLFSMSLKT